MATYHGGEQIEQAQAVLCNGIGIPGGGACAAPGDVLRAGSMVVMCGAADRISLPGGGCSMKVRSFVEGASSWQVTVLRRRLDRSAGFAVRPDRPNGTNDFVGLRAHCAGAPARGTATVAWRFARRPGAFWGRGPLPPGARTVVATSHRDGVLASVLTFVRDRPTGVHL
jgi:hypothetical protein